MAKIGFLGPSQIILGNLGQGVSLKTHVRFAKVEALPKTVFVVIESVSESLFGDFSALRES